MPVLTLGTGSGPGRAAVSAIEALLNPGGFAHPLAQIEKFGATHLAAALHLDGGHLGAVDHEHPLHADALEDAAHGDGFVHAAVALGDHHTLIGLNALFVALTDADAHLDGVAHINVRKIGLDLTFFKGAHQLFGAQLARADLGRGCLLGRGFLGGAGYSGLLGLGCCFLCGHCESMQLNW